MISVPCFCRAKYAIGAIKKKLNDKNPHVALYAFEVRNSEKDTKSLVTGTQLLLSCSFSLIFHPLQMSAVLSQQHLHVTGNLLLCLSRSEQTALYVKVSPVKDNVPSLSRSWSR